MVWNITWWFWIVGVLIYAIPAPFVVGMFSMFFPVKGWLGELLAGVLWPLALLLIGVVLILRSLVACVAWVARLVRWISRIFFQAGQEVGDWLA